MSTPGEDFDFCGVRVVDAVVEEGFEFVEGRFGTFGGTADDYFVCVFGFFFVGEGGSFFFVFAAGEVDAD